MGWRGSRFTIPASLAAVALPAVLLALGILSLSSTGCQQQSATEQAFASAGTDHDIVRIWETFGVHVHVRYDADSYFPIEWKRAPYSAQASQIEPDEGKRILRLIPGFLAMYPPELIAKNLRAIYLLKSMSFYGLAYGGTSSLDGIYITSEGQDRGYSDEFLSAAMHHEFSSILYTNYRFPDDEWSKVNDPRWRYVGEGKDLLGRTDVDDETEDLLRQGFIRVYGQACIEEDVNTYVSAVIAKRPFLVSAAARHKRVRQKLEILTRFYEGVQRQLRVAKDFEFLTRLKSVIDTNTDALSDPDAGSGRQR